MYFIELFLFFIGISFLGWIMEVMVCSIEARKFVNRGFLIGPYCPIYGFGGLLLLLLKSFSNNLIIVFCLSMILCSLLEYITSYLMELLFKVRWWDYSSDPFNLNGRICLRNSLAFGVLGTILVAYINPFFFKIIGNLSNKLIVIIGVISLIILILDIVISFNIMKNIKNTIANLNDKKQTLKDATDDIKDTIDKILQEKSYLYRRIIKSYNKFEYYRLELKDKVSKYKEEYNKKISNLKRKKAHNLIVFGLSGLIIGIIVGFITENISREFIFGLGLGSLINIIFDKVRKKDES